jgi:transcriptional regulator with XRE-family HTH domain
MTGAGSRLRFVRQRWHLSSVELAGKSGVSVGTIRRAESGDVEPDRLTVWKLSEALCVRPE